MLTTPKLSTMRKRTPCLDIKSIKVVKIIRNNQNNHIKYKHYKKWAPKKHSAWTKSEFQKSMIKNKSNNFWTKDNIYILLGRLKGAYMRTSMLKTPIVKISKVLKMRKNTKLRHWV